jgi:hypothetical protein
MYFFKKSIHASCLTECLLLKNLRLVIFVSSPQLQFHKETYEYIYKSASLLIVLVLQHRVSYLIVQSDQPNP